MMNLMVGVVVDEFSSTTIIEAMSVQSTVIVEFQEVAGFDRTE